MQQTVLCNFGRGHYEEHFFEIIMNLEQWKARRFPFKIFYSQQNCSKSGSLIKCDQLHYTCIVASSNAFHFFFFYLII